MTQRCLHGCPLHMHTSLTCEFLQLYKYLLRQHFLELSCVGLHHSEQELAEAPREGTASGELLLLPSKRQLLNTL